MSSHSLSILAPLPAQPNWQQKAEYLQRELYQRNQQLADAEDALRQERLKSAAMEQGVAELRTVLTPLYQGLCHIFGEIDRMGVESSSPGGAAPKSSAAWDSWKQKLGPNSAAAKIIDILMIHGELTHTQLRIHIGTSRMQTVYDAVSKLNKAALLNKNGDKFSLKEL